MIKKKLIISSILLIGLTNCTRNPFHPNATGIYIKDRKEYLLKDIPDDPNTGTLTVGVYMPNGMSFEYYSEKVDPEHKIKTFGGIFDIYYKEHPKVDPEPSSPNQTSTKIEIK